MAQIVRLIDVEDGELFQERFDDETVASLERRLEKGRRGTGLGCQYQRGISFGILDVGVDAADSFLLDAAEVAEGTEVEQIGRTLNLRRTVWEKNGGQGGESDKTVTWREAILISISRSECRARRFLLICPHLSGAKPFCRLTRS